MNTYTFILFWGKWTLLWDEMTKRRKKTVSVRLEQSILSSFGDAMTEFIVAKRDLSFCISPVS